NSLLQESARQRGNDSNVLYDLAMSAYALGKVPEAREAMERSLKGGLNGVDSENAKRFLTMIALEQPSPETANRAAEVDKILKAQPDYVPALMAQAAARIQQNDTNSAAQIYSNVLRKYPDFAP